MAANNFRSIVAAASIVIFLAAGDSSYSLDVLDQEGVCGPKPQLSVECVDKAAPPTDIVAPSKEAPEVSGALPEAKETTGSSPAPKEKTADTAPASTRVERKTAPADRRATVHFFWGNGCPHCAEEKPFLEAMKRKYPAVTVVDYEVWYDKDNARLLADMAEAYGARSGGVPITFIGERMFVGFREQSREEIENAIRKCSVGPPCPDPLERVAKKTGSRAVVAEQEAPAFADGPPKEPGEAVAPERGGHHDAGDYEKGGSGKEGTVVDIPFFGSFDVSRLSLPIMTLVIAGIDSFNPCAFFVLFSLLGLLVHAQSRKKMFFIGAVFVFFSGFIYFLFMSAWLNLFLVMGQVSLITTIAGGVSLVIAAINIKDFFAFKQGISLTIPASAKPKLFDRMRKLMKSTSLISILFGTSILAIAANSYELLCTAGFPMVFTRILTLNRLPTLDYYLYLVLYNVVYVVPLSIIVAAFTITLGRKKLTEGQGRVLKLVSGTMMLGLGGVLVFNPVLLNNMFVSVALLSGALAVSAAVVFATRKVGGRI